MVTMKAKMGTPSEMAFTGDQMRAKAKVPSAADLSNLYIYYRGHYVDSDNFDADFGSVQLAINGSEASIIGLYYHFPVKATFDAATGNLTVPNKQYLYTTTNYGDVYLYCMTRTWNDENKVTDMGQVNSIPFQYVDVDGQPAWVVPEISDYSDYFFLISTEDHVDAGEGFDILCYNQFMSVSLIANGIGMFKYVPELWEDAGVCTYTDGWYAPVFSNDPVTYELKVKKHVWNNGCYLIMNPYNAETPFSEVNSTPNAEGYIYLNLANPNCVMVRPFVNSGFQLAEIIGENVLLMNTNVEGFDLYMYKYSYDDIIEEFEEFGDEISTMDEKFLVKIPTCQFQVGYDACLGDGWVDSETRQPIDMVTTIQMPELGSVQGIINDVVAPVTRYYNLQGQQIAVPEKGQVVIEKTGSKAVKTIVR